MKTARLAKALAALLAALPLATHAAVIATFDSGSGTLSIAVTGGSSVELLGAGGRVTLNGADPDTGPLDPALVQRILVSGDSSANSVDFDGALASEFAALALATVNLGGGNDTYAGTFAEDSITVPLSPGVTADVRGGGGNDTVRALFLGVANTRAEFEDQPGGRMRLIMTDAANAASTATLAFDGVEKATVDATAGSCAMTAYYAGISAESLEIDLLGGPGEDTITLVDLAGADDTLVLRYGEDFAAPEIDWDSGLEPAVPGTITGSSVARLTFSLGDGADWLRAEASDATGGASQVTFNGGGGSDEADFGALPAQVTLAGNGGPGTDALLGGAGNDVLSGDADADTIAPGKGSDNVFGGTGADLIFWNAGDGNDRFSAAEATLRVTGASGNADETLEFEAGSARGGVARQIRFAGPGSTEFIGIDAIAKLDIRLGGGADTVTRTTWTLAPALADIRVDAGTGDDEVDLSGFDASGTAAYQVIGGDGADRLVAPHAAGFIDGGNDSDIVIGGRGADSLGGGGGDDFLEVAIDGGEDSVVGGPGTDRLDVIGSADADAFQLGLREGLLRMEGSAPGVAFSSSLLSTERVSVSGFSGEDAMTLTRPPAGNPLAFVSLSSGTGTATLAVNGSDAPESVAAAGGVLAFDGVFEVSCVGGVSEVTVDLLGGDDTVTADNAPTTVQRFLGGPGADVFRLRAAGAVSVSESGGTRTWTVPLRADTSAAGFESFPAEHWSLR